MVRAVIILIKLFSITTFVMSDMILRSAGEKRAKAIEHERGTYSEQMAAYMDRTVNPCDDFYEFSCGNYFKVHKVKHGVGSTDVFDIVTDEMNHALHDIFTQSADLGNTTVTDKAKLFYQSCMRVNIFDYPKSEVYLKLIKSLGGWPALNAKWNAKHFDWFNATITLASYGINAFIEVHNNYVENLRFEENIFGIHASMNARPFSREFNTNKGLIMKILNMYGVSVKDSRRIFREIVELYKEWKKFCDLYFNSDEYTMTVDELKEEVPEIDWERYLFALFHKEVNSSMEVTLRGKKYIRKLPTFFTSKNIKAAANYMFLQLLYGLHSEFLYPRYQRDFCIGKVSELMKDVVTAMYINSKHHKETIEDEVMSMASYMRSALKDIIKDNNWMDKETKRKALKKLRDMRMVIGDVELSLDLETLEKDYKDFKIRPDSNFYENNLALLQIQVRKLCNAFTNDEELEPEKYQADVNAYYDPSQNKLILPAGILRKPFFNPDLPKSYNFGAMGANIIGHEITHGFDSDGRHFDADGNEDDWWSSTADKAFDERAECFVKQYSSYHISEMNTNVKGRITLPENIADSGGVRQGYFAYKKWLKANEGYFDVSKETLPKLNMTNMQLFFLAYAQTYCTRYKRGGYQNIENDVHAVNKFRVIGSVSSFDQFSVEFNCTLGTTMNPIKKCVIW